jgi:hypothetical protein
MIGLPSETEEDVLGIAELSAARLGRGGRAAPVTASVSTFSPKPHTPFQWAGQLSIEETRARQVLLRRELGRRRIEFKWHDAEMSFLEGIFSRGDRRLADVIETAQRPRRALRRLVRPLAGSTSGARRWPSTASIPSSTCAGRPLGETLPWEHLDAGLSKRFLLQDLSRAVSGLLTPDCSIERCTYCGACDFESVRNVDYHAEGAKGGDHRGGGSRAGRRWSCPTRSRAACRRGRRGPSARSGRASRSASPRAPPSRASRPAERGAAPEAVRAAAAEGAARRRRGQRGGVARGRPVLARRPLAGAAGRGAARPPTLPQGRAGPLHRHARARHDLPPRRAGAPPPARVLARAPPDAPAVVRPRACRSASRARRVIDVELTETFGADTVLGALRRELPEGMEPLEAPRSRARARASTATIAAFVYEVDLAGLRAPPSDGAVASAVARFADSLRLPRHQACEDRHALGRRAPAGPRPGVSGPGPLRLELAVEPSGAYQAERRRGRPPRDRRGRAAGAARAQGGDALPRAGAA